MGRRCAQQPAPPPAGMGTGLRGAEGPRPARDRPPLEAVAEDPGEAAGLDDHLVDVHVLHVRRKLGDTAEAQRFVRTVRGVGYRIGTGA